MNIIPVRVLNIQAIPQQFKIGKPTQINAQQMDVIVQQTLQWAQFNNAVFKYFPQGGMAFKIQHKRLKKGWQKLQFTKSLSDQTYPQYCQIYFLNCNQILLVLTTGFTTLSRNINWKVSQISGRVLKRFLLM